jgi:hypothetical protein
MLRAYMMQRTFPNICGSSKEQGIREGTWLIAKTIIGMCSLSLNMLSPKRRSNSTSGKEQVTFRLLAFLSLKMPTTMPGI